MRVDLNQVYFLMSFRFDKNKPEDFGLDSCPGDAGVYIRPSDGSQWLQKDLYDFGWGNESGFVRLPELDFDQLWQLLTRSKLADNRYGAAFELQNKYSAALTNRLWETLSRQKPPTASLLKALEILDLNQMGDCADLMGRNIAEIESVYQKQQFVNWKLEFWKKDRELPPPNRNIYLFCGMLLLLLWAVTYTGRLFLYQLAQQGTIREALRLGGLAPLPEDVSRVQLNYNHLKAGGLNPEMATINETAHPAGSPARILLKFAAPRRQIARFLKGSPGLRGHRPQHFEYSEWYNAHLRLASQYPWFDPTTPKGRLFEIFPGKDGVSGRLIVDDAVDLVYIELTYR